MRGLRNYGLGIIAVAAAFAACTLNPQPLPPFDSPKEASPGHGFGDPPRSEDESPAHGDAGVAEPGAGGARDSGDAGGDDAGGNDDGGSEDAGGDDGGGNDDGGSEDAD